MSILEFCSSLGQNIKTSTFVWEICFAVFISISGLVLFSFLIGNMQVCFGHLILLLLFCLCEHEIFCIKVFQDIGNKTTGKYGNLIFIRHSCTKRLAGPEISLTINTWSPILWMLKESVFVCVCGAFCDSHLWDCRPQNWTKQTMLEIIPMKPEWCVQVEGIQ